jgi:hypothetical protein
MKLLFSSVVLAVLICACGGKKSSDQVNATDDAVTDNRLTDKQKAEGWKVLFNGETMEGWRPFKNLDNDNWEVLDGTLHNMKVNDSIETKRADLMTVDKYTNFDLTFDWRIAEKGNSGVIYLVTEDYEVPYASGPEYQLIDDVNYPGGLKEVNQTAANYDMQAASKGKKLNPPGQWNSSRIVINNRHVEHWLNGEKVLEYDLGSDAWKKQVASSKWRDFPGYGLAESGYIDLQDHGHEVWFRNIYIKAL